MINKSTRLSLTLSTALLALSMTTTSTTWAAAPYIRGAVGYDSTFDTRFRDRECSRQMPPALFGCQTGSDGRTIGGRGDFGDGTSYELAVGYRQNDRMRFELSATHQAGFDFSGTANFLNVSGSQPIDGKVHSSQAMILGLVDLPTTLPFSLQPFLGIGIGWARNKTDTIHYHFPGLGDQAATLVRGDARHDVAWQLRAGLSAPLNSRLTAELVLVYSDLGKVETGSGDAIIRRASGDRRLAIDATQARLRSRSARVGLRYSF